MASEYLKWKARDERPAPPSPPMTKKERAQNWLHYHKLHLIVAAVLVWIAGSMLLNLFGIGQVKPDYRFAYIGGDTLSREDAEALKAAFAALGEDVNGDGRVTIELRQYATDRGGDLETALYFNSAEQTRLLADMTAGDSYFFLLEDPNAVQKSYQILADRDGTPPEETDFEAMDKVLRLDALSLPVPELCSGLYLGRRCFYEEKQLAAHSADAAFWEILSRGA